MRYFDAYRHSSTHLRLADIDMKKQRDHKLHGWRSSCPPFSPAWIDPLPYTPYPPPLSTISSLKHKTPFSQASSPSSSASSSRNSSPKTFIYDHKLTMDPCYHPSHLLTHGQFLSHGAGPVPHRSLIPQFSYSPTTMHDDIITAFPLNWVEDVLPREDDPPFADKEDSRLHWRGSNTGMWHGGEEVLVYTDHEDPAHSDPQHNDGQPPQAEERREFVEGQMWWLSQRGRLVDWANKMIEDVIPRSRGSGGNGGWWKRSTSNDGTDEVETGIPIELRPRAPAPELDQDGNPVADPLLALSNATLSTRAYPKMKNSASRVLRSTPNRMWAVGEPSVEVPKARWAPAMADVAYSGEPINCEWYICDKLKQAYEFRKGHDGKAQGRYKYIMDVDGNGWSSRFKRLITSNALIFKSTIYPEWCVVYPIYLVTINRVSRYTDRFQPWVHYVPVQVDLSDLLDTLYFFRGDPAGNNGHPDLAEKIAKQGREWSLTHWRKVDMTAYMFRLFLEYARVMSEERDQKKDFEVETFEGEGESRRKVKKTEWAGMEDYVYKEEDEFYVV